MVDRLFANVRPARLDAGPPLCALAVDAEEDFDWLRPLPGTLSDTHCMRALGDLQSIVAAYGARPIYLLTYPVLQDDEAVRRLRRYRDRGACTLGVQLHSWVTPPIEGAVGVPASYEGNLPAELEERKLTTLIEAFRTRFGEAPCVFRAGRYGLGTATAALLERYGFVVDVSLAPRTRFTDDGGPDFSGFDCDPFWFGENRRLLEVPLCRTIVGWGGRPAGWLYRRIAAGPLPNAAPRRQFTGLLTRARAAERVTLSPEGNDIAAIRRLVRSLLRRGQRVLSLSFHSSSLRVGHNPYVGNQRDLHGFYDTLSATLSFMADTVGCRFVDMADLPRLMQPQDADLVMAP